MKKEMLQQDEFVNHVRAAIVNNKRMDKIFSTWAKMDDMKEFYFFFFVQKEEIESLVSETWPWLFVGSDQLFYALEQIAKEYIEGE